MKGAHRRTRTGAHRSVSPRRRLLLPAAVLAGMATASAALAATYTVQPGDTLSSIAARNGTSWQAVYAANRGTVGANPDLIYPGEVLTVGEAPPLTSSPAVKMTTVTGSATDPYTAFPGAACIVTRESGGNATAQNPDSTASGLFQDLQTTWNNYDGYAEAKYAPVSVQIAFNQHLAVTAGLSPWAADGCPGT